MWYMVWCPALSKNLERNLMVPLYYVYERCMVTYGRTSFLTILLSFFCIHTLTSYCLLVISARIWKENIEYHYLTSTYIIAVSNLFHSENITILFWLQVLCLKSYRAYTLFKNRSLSQFYCSGLFPLFLTHT